MKPTQTENTVAALERAGFGMRFAGQVMVCLYRLRDGHKLGIVNRLSLPRWLRGERVHDARGNALPSVEEAQKAKVAA